MRYIGPYSAATIPTLAQLFNDCTQARRAVINPLLADVTAASLEYTNAAPDLEDLEPIDLDGAAGNALIDAYENRTVAIKRRLAAMQASLPQAHADLCPYCTLDTGPQLDHYLPKVVFPEFALFAPNLLPICGRCNQSKGNSYIDADGGRLFLLLSHDLSDDASVLEAEISFTGEAHLRYYIDDGGALLDDELALVKRHFARLKLASRYARRGESALAAMKMNLEGKPPARIRRVILAGVVNAAETEPTNGWRSALYRELEDQIDETVAWISEG
jgi:hypothetical protein